MFIGRFISFSSFFLFMPEIRLCEAITSHPIPTLSPGAAGASRKSWLSSRIPHQSVPLQNWQNENQKKSLKGVIFTCTNESCTECVCAFVHMCVQNSKLHSKLAGWLFAVQNYSYQSRYIICCGSAQKLPIKGFWCWKVLKCIVEK